MNRAVGEQNYYPTTNAEAQALRRAYFDAFIASCNPPSRALRCKPIAILGDSQPAKIVAYLARVGHATSLQIAQDLNLAYDKTASNISMLTRQGVVVWTGKMYREMGRTRRRTWRLAVPRT